MLDIHEPDPEFTGFLEWQTRTELRRRDRFESPAFTSPTSVRRAVRFVRAAVLVLASLVCGAGVVVAAERIQDSRALELLLGRNGLLLALTERRVAAAVDVEQRERILYEQGVVSMTEIMRARSRVTELERDRDHLRLNKAEMEAARRAVDERLSARLVGPRDFVSEHLRVDRAWLEQARDIRTQQEERARALFEAGRVGESDLRKAAHAAAGAKVDIKRIEGRLALRADFLLDRIDALECESRDILDDARFRRTKLAGDVAHIDALLVRARQIEAAGFGSGDVTRLQGERDAVEVEVDLIDLELEMLR